MTDTQRKQLKSDSALSVQGNTCLRSEVENVVMNGSKVGKFGKSKGNKIWRAS